MAVRRSHVALLVFLVCLVVSENAAAPSRREYLMRLLLDTLQYRTTSDNQRIQATCVFENNPGLDDDIKSANNITGTVNFQQPSTGGGLTVSVNVTGIDPTSASLHGLHVHEFGDLSNGCASTGGHFNPFNKNHGGPTDDERHVGDFGNIQRTSDGSAEHEFVDTVASLLGANSIIGRAMVLHKDTDDLGRGGQSDSLTTGHAGARLACCVIREV